METEIIKFQIYQEEDTTHDQEFPNNVWIQEPRRGSFVLTKDRSSDVCQILPEPCVPVPLSSHLSWIKIIQEAKRRVFLSRILVHFLIEKEFYWTKRSPVLPEVRPRLKKRLPLQVGPLLDSKSQRTGSEINSGDSQMDPKDEKIIDIRLKSMEDTFREGLRHQTEVLDIRVNNLSELVRTSINESAAIKKEFLDNNRWWTRMLVVGMFTVIALFAGVVYFILNLSKDVTKETTESRRETTELRKEVYQMYHGFQKELQKVQPKR